MQSTYVAPERQNMVSVKQYGIYTLTIKTHYFPAVKAMQRLTFPFKATHLHSVYNCVACQRTK